MMSKKLIGYSEKPAEVNGCTDYHLRSYIFNPIYEIPEGYIATAAFRLCRECRGVISSMGGPGYRSVCLTCYPRLKIEDFSQGYDHTIIES